MGSSLEAWGSRILGAIERQERLFTSSLSNRSDPMPGDQHDSFRGEDSLEAKSRNDAMNTPITGAEMILRWPIFPKVKPFSTFPPYCYVQRPDRVAHGRLCSFICVVYLPQKPAFSVTTNG